MNKKILILLVSVVLTIGYTYADENKKQEDEFKIYSLRTVKETIFESKPKLYTFKELKDSFIENSKQINLKKLDNKITQKQFESSEQSKDDFMEKIWEMDDDKRELERKKKNIEELLAVDTKIPKGHPKKLKRQTRNSLYDKKDMLEDNIEAIEERIDDMEKQYIMIDFKYESDKLNADYNENSLKSFKQTELLNIKNKIIDILEENINITMKENELKFTSEILDMQRKSYQLGYSDANSLHDLENKVTVITAELKNKKRIIETKLDELAIICGIEKIDGFKLKADFFDNSLESKEAEYYKKNYQKNAYSLEQLEEQAKKITTAKKQLKYRDDSEKDANLMEAKADKLTLQEDIILENIEIAALNMLNNYDNLTSEISKLSLKLNNAKRNLDGNSIKLSLGQISKLDYNKSEFEYQQMKYGTDLMDLNLLRIKILLSAMASGIVKQ